MRPPRTVPGRAGRAALGGLAVVAAATLLAGCGIAASTVPIPTVEPSPTQVLSAAVTVTANQIDQALHGVGLTVIASPVPYRPGESPTLAQTPRLVLKAQLPDDDAQGFIVVYDFPTPQAAFAGGSELAAYLASGPGRVQFPNDAQHVIRQVGSTLVFYSWSPVNSPNGHAADVGTALDTLGVDIPIVR